MRTNLICGLLPEGDAVPPDDLLLADEGVIAGDLKTSYSQSRKIIVFHTFHDILDCVARYRLCPDYYFQINRVFYLLDTSSYTEKNVKYFWYHNCNVTDGSMYVNV